VLFSDPVNLFLFRLGRDGGCQLVCPKGYTLVRQAPVPVEADLIWPLYELGRANIVVFQTDMELQIMVAKQDMRRYGYPYLPSVDQKQYEHDRMVVEQKISLLMDALRQCTRTETMGPTMRLMEDRIRHTSMQIVPPLSLESMLIYLQGHVNLSSMVQLTDHHSLVIQLVVDYQGAVLFLPIEPSPLAKSVLSYHEANIAEYGVGDLPTLVNLVKGMYKLGSVIHRSLRPWALVHYAGNVIGVELECGLPVGCQEEHLSLPEAQRQLSGSVWAKMGFKEIVWDFRKRPLLAANELGGTDERTMRVGRLFFERETYQRIRLEMSAWLRAHPDTVRRIKELIAEYETKREDIEMFRMRMEQLLLECIDQFAMWIDEHPGDPSNMFLHTYSVPSVRQFCSRVEGVTYHCVEGKLVIFRRNLLGGDSNRARYSTLLADEMLRSPFLRDEILFNQVKVVLQDEYHRGDVVELPVGEDYKSASLIKRRPNMVEDAISRLYVKRPFTAGTGSQFFMSDLNPTEHPKLMEDLGPQRTCFQVFRGNHLTQWTVLAKHIGDTYHDSSVTVQVLKERVLQRASRLSFPDGMRGWQVYWKYYLSHSCGMKYTHLEPPSNLEAFSKVLMQSDHPLTLVDLLAVADHYKLSLLIYDKQGRKIIQLYEESNYKWLVLSTRFAPVVEGSIRSFEETFHLVANVCSFPQRVVLDRGASLIKDAVEFTHDQNKGSFIHQIALIKRVKRIMPANWNAPQSALMVSGLGRS
jgi:hypothetical protein